MKELLPRSTRLGAALLATLCLFVSLAHAQGRGERREVERRDFKRERFATPHWVFDNRFHHDHYYPQIGYSVRTLPASRIAITFRGAPFFFQAGVWYRPSGPGFIVIRPPIGIVVPVLPPSYTTVWVGTAPYYYADDVFYDQTNGGYAVVAPPAGYDVEQGDVPPAQPAVPPAAPQAGSAIWYYCESSKTYYPYVSECKEGWKEVPAAPPHG